MNRHDGSEAAFRAVRQRVHDDPVLQERLFALDDPADFIVAVQRLASSIGHTLEKDEISQAMDAGNRAWFERLLP